MNQPIDWSSGWATIQNNTAQIPHIIEIENYGHFRSCRLTTKVFRIEVECNNNIWEKSIPLNPGADLADLNAELNQHYRGSAFSVVQDMIDNAWGK